MRTLVVVDQSDAVRRALPFVREVRVGWRITAANGESYDAMWGSVLPSRLDALLAELRAQHGPEVDLLDLRGKPELVRDRHYWEQNTPRGSGPRGVPA
jgi:hypothetical protein